VNFMDGANGIAMGTAAIILLGLAALFVPAAVFGSDRGIAGLSVAMCVSGVLALAGFLAWNLRGQLYAGDAGSLAIGGLIGGASVVYAQTGPVLIPLTLCLPILIDVFMTLGWRALKRRPLMQAHRDHAYQLMLRAGASHGVVARRWWAMTTVCLVAVLAVPVSALTGVYSLPGLPLGLITFVSLLMAGIALWVQQRTSLGRQLTAAGK
jgi:UDP-GlcNAc:undecaprenyl-phosphate/decaprenyl-phosphate GlcNAc-1-phosphate transferase